MKKLFCSLLMMTALLMSIFGSALAEQPGKDWYVAIRLGYQPFDLENSGKVSNRDFDIHTSLSDIMDKADTTLAGGEIEFGMGRWFITLPTAYMKIEAAEGDTTRGITAMFKQVSFNPLVGYRVYQQRMGGDQVMAMDVMAGIFYVKTSVDIALYSPILGNLSRSGDFNIVDAMVGARVSYGFTKQFAISGFGEIGAGGSDLQYVVAGNLSYSFTNWFSVFGGYKYWYFKYKDDGKPLSEFVQKVYGPVVGVQFKF